MAGGYSVLNALNRNTRQQAEEKPGGRFRTKDISITDIYPNGYNFYAMQAHPNEDARKYLQEHFQQTLGKVTIALYRYQA